MAQLETLIGDFCRVVSEYLLLAEEWERSGANEIYLLPLDESCRIRSSPVDGATKRSYAELTAIAATTVDELGKQLAYRLESQGIDSKELRRFLRAVRLWQLKDASSLWDDVELDLEAIALRLQHGIGTKPPPYIADEAPAEGTEKKSKHCKAGRPNKYDPKKDEQIYDAWQSGDYLNYSEVGKAFRVSEDAARKARERHRKWLENQAKKGLE